MAVDVGVDAGVDDFGPRSVTVAQVEARLRDAMATAAMLDDSERHYLASLRSAMPTPLPDRRRDYADEEPRTARPRPTSDAIGLMDEALAWLWWIDDVMAHAVVMAVKALATAEILSPVGSASWGGRR